MSPRATRNTKWYLVLKKKKKRLFAVAVNYTYLLLVLGKHPQSKQNQKYCESSPSWAWSNWHCNTSGFWSILNFRFLDWRHSTCKVYANVPNAKDSKSEAFQTPSIWIRKAQTTLLRAELMLGWTVMWKQQWKKITNHSLKSKVEHISEFHKESDWLVGRWV